MGDGVVNVVTMAFPPFVSYTKGEDCTDFRILDTIAEFYKIRVEVKEPADGQWGQEMENGSWTGVVGTVVKREADLSMNLALTGAREKVIDYSVAYIDEPLTFSVSS